MGADADVLIIGAGASGLAAALELCRAGRSVLLCEARGRVGGRIDTRHEPGLAHPIELGAEFIHGEAPLTRQLMRAAGIVAVDTAGRRITRPWPGSPERPLDFEAIQGLMQRAAGLPQDLSIEEFLERYAGGESRAEERRFVRRMVEGFDAADPREASAQAIAAEWTGQSMGGQYRPLGGYESLLGALTRALAPGHTRMMLDTVVREVEWGGNRVRVLAQTASGEIALSAAQAIVTLPVSLLQSTAPGAVRFTPALQEKRAALEGLAMGPVIKVVMHFRQSFWEELAGGQFADAGFLHAPDAPFPTLWTSLPYRVPLLTAWMGGPRAARLAGVAPAARVAQALQSVQSVFGLSEPPEAELIAAQ